MSKIRYINGKLIKTDSLKLEEFWCAEGKFISPKGNADAVVDLQGAFVAPGYIDLQINGLHGVDFTLSPDSVADASLVLPQYGVTSFLPTLISQTPASYRHSIPRIPQKRKGANILGIHLEGPFLNPLYMRAHDKSYALSFEGNNPLISCYGTLENVRLVTLAPELPEACRWIQFLKSQGVRIAAGHTNCSAEQYEAAVEAGVCMATHLFNAMEPFHHRKQGIIGEILGKRQGYYSIIADGIHLDPLTVQLAWNAHPEGLVLISDASAAAGLKTGGRCQLGEQTIETDGRRVVLKGTDTLAGSTLTLDKAVRNLHRFTGCSIVEAVQAASYKPAVVLGLERAKGILEEGFDADFVLLNDALEPIATFIDGHEVWRKEHQSSSF